MVTHIYILVNPIIIHIKGNDKKLDADFINSSTFFFLTALNKDVIIKQVTIQLNENIIPKPLTRL